MFYYLIKLIFLLIPLLVAFSSLANINPEGLNLNYAQKALSGIGNPAAAALVVKRNDANPIRGGYLSAGGGVEFGDLDEIFDKINDISNEIDPPDEPENAPPTPENPDKNPLWDDLFLKYPELEDRLDIIKDRVLSTAALLALIQVEGYAKAAINAHASFILNENLYGGTLLLGSSFKGTSKALGIAEVIEFDAGYALEQLKTLPSFSDTDPIQDIDLSSGIVLHYDPSHQNSSISIENDSLLLVKSTKVAEFSLAYSHIAKSFDQGDLYWGVKPTFYRVGLTNVTARLGDITDAEELFDDIKDADYIYRNGFDFDMGLVFSASNYQLGLSLNNALERTYDFPKIDRRRYSSEYILRKLDSHATFTMERQSDFRGWIIFR